MAADKPLCFCPNATGYSGWRGRHYPATDCMPGRMASTGWVPTHPARPLLSSADVESMSRVFWQALLPLLKAADDA